MKGNSEEVVRVEKQQPAAIILGVGRIGEPGYEQRPVYEEEYVGIEGGESDGIRQKFFKMLQESGLRITVDLSQDLTPAQLLNGLERALPKRFLDYMKRGHNRRKGVLKIGVTNSIREDKSSPIPLPVGETPLDKQIISVEALSKFRGVTLEEFRKYVYYYNLEEARKEVDRADYNKWLKNCFFAALILAIPFTYGAIKRDKNYVYSSIPFFLTASLGVFFNSMLLCLTARPRPVSGLQEKVMEGYMYSRYSAGSGSGGMVQPSLLAATAEVPYTEVLLPTSTEKVGVGSPFNDNAILTPSPTQEAKEAKSQTQLVATISPKGSPGAGNMPYITSTTELRRALAPLDSNKPLRKVPSKNAVSTRKPLVAVTVPSRTHEGGSFSRLVSALKDSPVLKALSPPVSRERELLLSPAGNPAGDGYGADENDHVVLLVNHS